MKRKSCECKAGHVLKHVRNFHQYTKLTTVGGISSPPGYTNNERMKTELYSTNKNITQLSTTLPPLESETWCLRHHNFTASSHVIPTHQA